jgi:hypothetical protein
VGYVQKSAVAVLQATAAAFFCRRISGTSLFIKAGILVSGFDAFSLCVPGSPWFNILQNRTSPMQKLISSKNHNPMAEDLLEQVLSP